MEDYEKNIHLKIYQLDFNDELYLRDGTKIQRVAGGWIYSTYGKEEVVSTAFVPFNNEFQNNTANKIFKLERKRDELAHYFDNPTEALAKISELNIELKKLKDEKANK